MVFLFCKYLLNPLHPQWVTRRQFPPLGLGLCVVPGSVIVPSPSALQLLYAHDVFGRPGFSFQVKSIWVLFSGYAPDPFSEQVLATGGGGIWSARFYWAKRYPRYSQETLYGRPLSFHSHRAGQVLQCFCTVVVVTPYWLDLQTGLILVNVVLVYPNLALISFWAVILANKISQVGEFLNKVEWFTINWLVHMRWHWYNLGHHSHAQLNSL